MGMILKKHVVDEDVLTLARQRMAQAFDQFDTVMVSFSGGKDSTVVLNLALEEAERRNRLPLWVLSFDEEAIPYQTEDYMRRVANDPRVNFTWLCLPVVHRNGCSKASPVWYPWAPEDEDKWVRPMPPEGLTTYGAWPTDPPSLRLSIPDGVHLLFDKRTHGRTVMLMGIRADESLLRQRAVSRREVDNWLIPHFPGTADRAWVWKGYPIYDWSTPDVWRAPAQLGWDTNEAYDLMEMAGMPWEAQRCAPPYGEQPMRGLWTFKVCFPELWDRMAVRVPGAQTAARYASTELYGAGRAGFTGDDLAEGDTWDAKCARLLEEHPEGVRQFVANKIVTWAKWHYLHTTDPILFAPHPVTGVGWQFLLRVAEKGDFKDRLQPPHTLDETVRARMRSAYEAERSQQ